MSAPREFTALFPFCGLGAGGRGFLEGMARLDRDEARFRSMGGIDLDAEACADFETLTGSPALQADLSRLTSAELLAWLGVRGNRRPDAVFLSPPCKGFSRLLSAKQSLTAKYQALNQLVYQGLFLVLETWAQRPPLLVIENVPGIAQRGAELLDRVRRMLSGYGYVFHEATHDCGVVGGLAQHRRRFLLVARDPRQVCGYVYQPPRKRVRGCGEVIGELPLPADPAAGPLHRLPDISWLNWVRLALIPPGGDWRDLPRAVTPAAENPGRHEAKHRVEDWATPAHSVTGATRPGSGAPAVADPRTIELGRTAAGAEAWKGRPGLLGVLDWEQPSPAVVGRTTVSGGHAHAAVAQPFAHAHRVTAWSSPVGTVTHAPAPSSGGGAVADPRLLSPVQPGQTRREVIGRYRVLDFREPSPTVAGSGTNGVYGVADPRAEELALGCAPRSGVYGVLGWDQAAATITGVAQVDNGRFAIADPRIGLGWEPPEGIIPVILSAWGCWHRPLTTLELGALQGLPATLNGRPLQLAGRAVSRWRERIGNAVPVQAGSAIAESLLKALLASAIGHWSILFSGDQAVWVRDDGQLEPDAEQPGL